MCTGFISNFNRPLYGMNFDYPETELKIVIDKYDGNSYFVMSFKAGDIFVNTVGMNSNGVFVSLQMLPDDDSEIIKSSPDNLPAMLLFLEVLKNAQTVEDALKMLDGKRFVVLRRPKGHCLIGDLTGSSVIIEEGKEDNEIIRHEKFAVMTNFKNSDFKNMKYNEVIGFGADRYIKAFEMLSRGFNSFGVKDGFDVLEGVSTSNDNFQTQFSAMFDPVNLCIYIVFKRSYGQIWKLSLNESNIETFSGFEVNQRRKVDSSGVLCSTLQNIS